MAENADIYDTRNFNQPGVLQDVASTSTHTEWIPATDKYVSPADISFTATAAIMQPCDLTGDLQTIEFFKLL